MKENEKNEITELNGFKAGIYKTKGGYAEIVGFYGVHTKYPIHGFIDDYYKSWSSDGVAYNEEDTLIEEVTIEKYPEYFI